jgi:two-component system, chemotaxis family, CheB/CheR fusion protein
MPESVTQKARAVRPGSSSRQSTRLGVPQETRVSEERRVPEEPGPDFPVVAVGASAGGLDACRKLVTALPANTGMAFILVQHLDPTHESMMVDLLAGHTSMQVCQAANGMPIECDHFYVIPPGTYLSVHDGVLRLSQPLARHGARLPFDFLLHSLATDRGASAICVILSGSGADGSLGLRAVKENHGLVIAQDPAEAGYDGMPRSAIATGAVDLILSVSKMPDALVKYGRRITRLRTQNVTHPPEAAQDWLPEIIELLRARTAHDFTLYKPGTLQRRIERRMAMAAIETDDMYRYLDLLRGDQDELELLFKDLLINVTSFFRDPKVFELLGETLVPDMLRNQRREQPLRVWVAGCSTGEETYSIAMLFQEQITAAKLDVKMQIFASDIDPDAVASAREGLYSETIEAEVSAARLARFFVKEDHGYRISSDLRASVIFTVQDVLTDPPFSRIDMVSCRNLLIYLRPEAQAKVISLFHFALRDGGILLLGGSETSGNDDGRFEVISKQERLYRHIGRGRPSDAGLVTGIGRVSARPEMGQEPSRQVVLAELCRRLVIESHAPAAVLVNHKLECLFSLGPTERYLRVAPGAPTHDLLAIAHPDMRTKLRSAIQQANHENVRVVTAGGRTTHNGHGISFSIDIQPVLSDGEALLLICFVNETAHERSHARPVRLGETTALELELETTRAELQGAIRSLEISNEEQKAINEEALSVQEEFQSTNEELLTSKEELQSLNEELTALNSQLQETLEKQRTTANDLQNVLYSTDVATIFLDAALNIRFFTPATKALFSVIPGDIGRPLADLSSLSIDNTLLTDAKNVLRTLASSEREIETQSGAWYLRRILPYRTRDSRVEGVVITFADITVRTHAADALGIAKRQAEQANVAKSRFLAAASHDLRQPLQTLSLVRGLLAQKIKENKTHEALALVGRLDDMSEAMTSMLDTLLDINQIEAGTIQPEIVAFPVNDLLDRLRDDFTFHATEKNVVLKVVPCGLMVRSDPRLLEQMIRNLLSNALKYTNQGTVLLGCRRRAGALTIEVWDTGIGIPADEFQAIFEEYHQIGNDARERSRGLGLGLPIVRRLGNLLGHRVWVRSRLGKGSVFSVEIARLAKETAPTVRGGPWDPGAKSGAGPKRPDAADGRRTGAILIVEDDLELCELLALVLTESGHQVATAHNGIAAIDLLARGVFRPDLILADYNLPKGMNGLQLTNRLRERPGGEIPVIILTGDISTGTLRDIALRNCVQLNKPVKPDELGKVIQRLLSSSSSLRPSHIPPVTDGPVIFVVDDDDEVRAAVRDVLENAGRMVEDYPNCEEFLEAYHPGREACLVIDAYLPGMNGLDLLRRLHDQGDRLPAIMITGNGEVSTAVQAMKAGASDFIEKPIGHDELLTCVDRALEQGRDTSKQSAWREDAANHVAGLTVRQRQIMEMVLSGHPSKNIAADLGISQRTVENHRASIMKKTGSKSLPALARLAVAADAGNAAGMVERR